jgi:GT2 family glycosyltransferase
MAFTVPYSVAIVILNWNGWEYTRNCLNSLINSGFPPDQVFLVDNHSEDGSYELIETHFTKINLTRNTINKGFAGGNNVGMELALIHGFEYVLLLNNDTEPKADFLGYLVEEMESSKNYRGYSAFDLPP